MTDYIIDVSELLEATGSSESVDAPFPLEVLKVGDVSFPLAEPAAVDVMITYAGSGIVASGTVTARVIAECARCLCQFEVTLTGSVEGFYVRHTQSPDDEDAELIRADSTIDLAPALIAALLIEAPFAPLHDPNCRGLCPSCGADLNAGECGCASAPDDDHPFAALRDLLNDREPGGE